MPPVVVERLEEIESDCKPAVRCKVLDPYDEPNGVLAEAQCRLVIGDPSYTFWSYFIIRFAKFLILFCLIYGYPVS